ncbi:UNVERIFIED_CONTAM: hypothetical protein Sindi_2499500 [Sesamum indicum]
MQGTIKSAWVSSIRRGPSFLDIATAMENAPNPFLDAPAPMGRCLPPESEEDLDNILEEVEIVVRDPLPKASIDSIAGDLSRDGALKERDTPKDGDAHRPEASVAATTEEKDEGLACGEKN